LSQIDNLVRGAGQILSGLKGNQKDADQIALLQGANFLGLAIIYGERQEWAEALPWLNRGIDHFQALVKAGAANPEFANRAVLLQGRRAQTYYELRQFAEALTDVDQVLAKGGNALAFGLLRCGILARSGAHREGVAALEKLLAGTPGSRRSDVLYDAACICAVAIEGLTKDTSLSEKQRDELTSVYAAKAVDFLSQAVKAGYRQLDKIRDPEPAGDRDLTPLRGQNEFKQFLRELPQKK
jgi:hypothetical protein